MLIHSISLKGVDNCVGICYCMYNGGEAYIRQASKPHESIIPQTPGKVKGFFEDRID